MSTSAHPACPDCGTNNNVLQLVRVVEDEYRWLDAQGDVANTCEGKYREDRGWGWHCTHCNKEWELSGSLAKEPQSTDLRGESEICSRILDEIKDKLLGESSQQIPGGVEMFSSHLNALDMRELGARLLAWSNAKDRLFPSTARSAIPLSTTRQYLAKHHACPSCREDEAEGGNVTIEEGMAHQELWCLNCDATWLDIYVLSGFDDLDTL